MGAEDNRHAALGALARQPAQQPATPHHIKAARRLVHTAPLALGERVHVRAQQRVRAQDLDQLRHALGRHADSGRGHQRLHRQVGARHALHPLARDQRDALDQRGALEGVLSQHQRRATHRPPLPRQDVQQARLAGAVGPDQHHLGAAADAQGDVTAHARRAVG
eukprot:scaffold341_cov63-Phaeocystis_antarctica.AAC.5